MISRKKRKQRAPGASLCLLAPASAVCAGAVIYLKEIIDIARFNRIAAGDFTVLYLPAEPFSFFLRALLLILLVSATLGFIEAAALYGVRALEQRFFRNLSVPRRLFAGTACISAALLVVIVPVAVLLFQGQGISRQWYAPYGPWATAFIGYLLALLLVWCGMRWHGRLRAKGSAALYLLSTFTLLLAGSAFLSIDGHFYPGLYDYLHDFLLLLSFFSFQLAAILVFETTRIFSFALLRRTAAALIVGLFCAGPLILRGYASSEERHYLGNGTDYLQRTVYRVRSLLDLDRDGYSAVLGGGDGNDLDRSVHPFARDVPDDGIDQDCLGGDASSETAKKFEDVWRRKAVRDGDLLQGNPYADFNIVVVCADALRSDRLLHPERYEKLLPNLYRLAGEGVSFSRAFSPGSGTGTSLPVALTSRYDGGAAGAPTLFEILKENGYTTMLATTEKVTGPFESGEYSNPFRGIDAKSVLETGDNFRANWTITSDEVTDLAIGLLDRHGNDRFALYVHYFDIHDAAWISDERLGAGGRSLDERYDAAAAFVDGELGRLLDALEERGLRERTILVLFADHGEGLADKGIYFHTSYAFNSLVHVPFLLRAPAFSGPIVLTEPVGLVDLTPTVLSLLGIETAARFDGESLVPLMLGREAARTTPLLINEAKQRAVILGDYKLLITPEMNLLELFDIRNDFGETRNLAEKEEEKAREMYGLLMSSPVAGERPVSGPH